MSENAKWQRCSKCESDSRKNTKLIGFDECQHHNWRQSDMYWDGTQIAGTLTANNAGGGNECLTKRISMQ